MRTARSWSTSKVTRSRWFTPTSVAPTASGPLELGLVVHLDERVEADARRRGVEAAQLRVGQRGRDQQHGVGAHQPGVAHVVARRP